MSKQKDQIEIPDIDNHPLGIALKELADCRDVLEEAQENYDDKREKVGRELAAVNKDHIKAHGLEVRIKTTPGSSKVVVKKKSI